MYVLSGVGEVGALTTVQSASIDKQRLVTVFESGPPDLALIEVDLGTSVLDPIEQFKAVLFAVIHRQLLSLVNATTTPLQRHYIGTSVQTGSACPCGPTGRNPA
jgi:hypothetical protein